VGHKLAPVADTQDRYTQPEDLGVVVGRICFVDTARTSSEDNANGIQGFQFRKRSGIGLYLAVDITFPNPAGNELIILTTKIQDNYHLMIHPVVLLSLIENTW
jgi:hypothetical protein